jgi:hypothetical protein
VKGTTNLDIVNEIYKQSEVQILASESEGLPLTLIESMSAKKPWISTPVGGVPGVFGKLKGGKVLGNIAFSPEELESAVRDCGKINGNVPRKEWEKNYSYDIITKKYLEQVEETLAKEKKSISFKISVPERNKDAETVQTMWIGDKLSPMEQVALSSFVYKGHNVHLYTYSDIENVPDGVVIKDGNEILPEDMIFSYKTEVGKGSYSAFSNYFRYKLLYDKGGYWVDTDMICQRSLSFFNDREYVFAQELVPPTDGAGNVSPKAASCVIKMPQGSPAAKFAYETCLAKDKDTLKWGEVGPNLVETVINEFNLNEYRVAYHTFCPIVPWEWQVALKQGLSIHFPEEVFAVHMWNEMWRRNGVDKSSYFHPDCWYEKLKRKYLEK